MDERIAVTASRARLLSILILAAAIRFVQIDSPPVGHHAWRQSDTASVARNYLRLDGRFAYPQIDWAIPGYVEMEFPVYPWTAAALYRWTGESHAMARGLSVLGWLLVIVLLHGLVRRTLDERIALWAAGFVAVLPLGLFLGRAIMPESWMLAASMAGLYAFYRWIEEERAFWFLLAATATALACLLKPTALYLGLPYLWLAWRRWGPSSLRRWQIWVFGALVLLPMVAWYTHAYRLGQEYGVSFNVLTAAGVDKWGAWDLLLRPGFYQRVFLDTLGGRLLTWAGLALFVAGLFVPRRTGGERLFDIWFVAVVIVLLLANGGSFQHDYYSIPLLLPAAVFMAKASDRLWCRSRAAALALLILIVALGLYRYFGRLADERRPSPDRAAAAILVRETEPSDRIITCNRADPTWFYLADRRGWGRDCGQLGRDELEALIAHGATYLAAPGTHDPTRPMTGVEGHTRSLHEVVHDDDNLFLARFDPPVLNEGAVWPWSPAPELDGSLPWRQPTCLTCGVRVVLDFETETDGVRRSVIKLWTAPTGAGVQIVLLPRRDTIRFLQLDERRTLEANSIPHTLANGGSLALELRFDGLDFELILDDRSVLRTPNRLPYPLTGLLHLRAARSGVSIGSLEISTPTPRRDVEPGRD